MLYSNPEISHSAIMTICRGFASNPSGTNHNLRAPADAIIAGIPVGARLVKTYTAYAIAPRSLSLP